MFSDSISECTSTLIKEYLWYDDYSFNYKEELIEALSHLYSILYKLDIPPGLEEDLPIGVFKMWAINSIEKAVFQKANCDGCLEECVYCEGCIRFKKNIEHFKQENRVTELNNN
jgi:hypothetical protein